MDEATAHKILLWLCNRWKKRLERYYAKVIVNSKPDGIMINFLDNDFWLMRFDGTINLKFEYCWEQDYDYSLSPRMHRSISRLMLYEEEYGHAHPVTVPLLSTLKTDADLLEYLFNMKNDFYVANSRIYVEDWAEEDVCFIDKDESLEEIIVKADLEEIDD